MFTVVHMMSTTVDTVFTQVDMLQVLQTKMST